MCAWVLELLVLKCVCPTGGGQNPWELDVLSGKKQLNVLAQV